MDLPNNALWQTASAKINLFLEILGRRPDGFHEIQGVFLEVPRLHDTLHAVHDDDLSLQCSIPSLSCGPDNLVLRAFEALRLAAGVKSGARIFLEKRIPVAAGLGGGSSDAAAALRLANRLWNCGAAREDLARIGATLGSDVAFSVYGGVCLCEGRGEKVTPLPGATRTALGWRTFLIATSWSVFTAEAYEAFSRCAETVTLSSHRSVEPMLAALTDGRAEAIRGAAFNRFAEAGVMAELAPGHVALVEALRLAEMPGPWLSGSGPTLWTLGAPGDWSGDAPEIWEKVAAKHGARLL